MARAAAAFLAAAVLAACTPMQWVREDAAGADVAKDEAECRQAAWREASARYWFYQPLAPVFVPHPAGGGFFAWPSGSLVDPFGSQLMEEHRLTQFCMESKGYRLQPVPKP